MLIPDDPARHPPRPTADAVPDHEVGAPAHIDALDGFRGFAAMVVVVSHFANRTMLDVDSDALIHAARTDPGALGFDGFQKLMFGALGNGAGQMGVMIFFALSAFLMFHLYAEAKPTRANVWNFLVGRVARIFPLYYFALGLAFVTAVTLPFTFIEIAPNEYLAHVFFVQGNHVFWTIAPELLFYVVFAVLWGLGLCRARYLLVPALIVFAGANFLPVVWKSYAVEFFVLGYLIYLYQRSGRRIGLWRSETLSVLLFVGLFAVHLPAVQKVLFAPETMEWENPAYVLMVAALFVIVFESRVLRRVFASPPMAFLGKISFSVYLLHLFVLHGLLHYGLIGPDLLSLGLVVALVVGTSALSFHLLEAPARRGLRRALSMRREAADHRPTSGAEDPFGGAAGSPPPR